MDEPPPPADRDVARAMHARVAIQDEAELTPEWPPPSSPPVRPPLRRRARGKWVAGVAGGLADRWGVPALALRIPLAVTALIWGILLLSTVTNDYLTFDPDSIGLPSSFVLLSFAAVVGYVVLWIVLPREDVGRSPARRLTERYPGIRSVPGFVALAVGGAILADRLGIWEPDLVIAAGLIALGVWLYRRDREVASGARVAERPRDGTVVVGSEGPAAEATPVVRPPRERSPLGWIAFGAALLASCLTAIVLSAQGSFGGGASGLTKISAIPAVGLVVLAGGLIVGSVFGRARWLILPALLVTPVVLVTSVIGLPFEGGFGDTFLRPHDLGELEVATHRNAMGSIYVDLARFQGRPEVRRELRLSTVLGTVTVVVPFDAHVRIDAATGLGTLDLGPQRTQGLEVTDSASLEPRHGDGATFTVHVDVGLGDVHVLRYAATKRELRELRRDERLVARQEQLAEREARAAA